MLPIYIGIHPHNPVSVLSCQLQGYSHESLAEFVISPCRNNKCLILSLVQSQSDKIRNGPKILLCTKVVVNRESNPATSYR